MVITKIMSTVGQVGGDLHQEKFDQENGQQANWTDGLARNSSRLRFTLTPLPSPLFPTTNTLSDTVL